MATEPPITLPSRDLEEVEILDNSLSFPAFTSQTAWALGSLLRTKLLAFDKPTVIDISLAQGNHCLFHCTTHSGTTPDNDNWVARKRNTVLRWSCSSWYMHLKFGGNEEAFAQKFGLREDAPTYAIHGGGWCVISGHTNVFLARAMLTRCRPVRVRGVEGVVAVVVVSGLRQEQDHGIIVETVGEMMEELSEELGEKKKED